jgi:hypothetical protein
VIAILPARVFFRASDFKVRTSSVVHDRRLPFFMIKFVGTDRGVVSGVFNLESSGVAAPDRRPCHEEHYTKHDSSQRIADLLDD